MTNSHEALAKEAAQAALCLLVMKESPASDYAYGDSYKRVGINYSIAACEIAAKLTGVDLFYAKMLNYQFRTDAAEMMFERALAEAA